MSKLGVCENVGFYSTTRGTRNKHMQRQAIEIINLVCFRIIDTIYQYWE